MQHIEKFKFFIGTLWICMGFIGLIGRRISCLRRVLFMLMSVFYAAIGFAGAFHTDLSALIGISSSAVLIIMLLLPSIIILLGIWDRDFKRKDDPTSDKSP